MRRENNSHRSSKDIEEVKADASKTGAAFIVGGNLFAGPINSLRLFYA